MLLSLSTYWSSFCLRSLSSFNWTVSSTNISRLHPWFLLSDLLIVNITNNNITSNFITTRCLQFMCLIIIIRLYEQCCVSCLNTAQCYPFFATSWVFTVLSVLKSIKFRYYWWLVTPCSNITNWLLSRSSASVAVETFEISLKMFNSEQTLLFLYYACKVLSVCITTLPVITTAWVSRFSCQDS